MPPACTVITSVEPMLNSEFTAALSPLPNDIKDTTAATPMNIPKSVSQLLIPLFLDS